MSRARFAAVAALALALAAGPALAVGFGPLSASGTIDGPREGFTFELMNPYPAATDFRVYAIGPADEASEPRVTLYPADATLGGGRSRRVLAVADDLRPGETFHFRVCAERRDPSEETLIHARVCSKVTARRVG